MWPFKRHRDACHKVIHSKCSACPGFLTASSQKPSNPFQTPFSCRFTFPLHLAVKPCTGAHEKGDSRASVTFSVEMHTTDLQVHEMWSHLPSPYCCVQWGTCEQPPAMPFCSYRSYQWGPSGARYTKDNRLVRKQPESSEDSFALSCSKTWTEPSLHVQKYT